MNETAATTRPTLETADPSGRFDVMLYRLARHFVKRAEVHHNLPPLWDKGVGEIVEAGIQDLGVPSRVFTPVDVARAIGLLPRKVLPNSGRPRARQRQQMEPRR